MAHSIRLGKGMASGSGSSVYIPDAVHARIWRDASGHTLPAPRSSGGYVGRFPFLSRLADPYYDATIWPTEIVCFRAELEYAATSLDPGTPEARVVVDLIELTKEAERAGSGLDCYGD